MDDRLSRLGTWSLEYGRALVPVGPDTYGEGMRDAKSQVSAILRDCPETDGTRNKCLVDALKTRENDFAAALDRLRNEIETSDSGVSYWLMREAVELVRCLRRIAPACTVQEIHKAFGAPGDFGYETPIGEALARLYSEQSR